MVFNYNRRGDRRARLASLEIDGVRRRLKAGARADLDKFANRHTAASAKAGIGAEIGAFAHAD